MNTELLGMDNEELAQWAHREHGIRLRDIRRAIARMEVFCAQETIGLGYMVERVCEAMDRGMNIKEAVRTVKEEECG